MKNQKSNRKYLGLAVMLLMVISVGMPLLQTVDSSNNSVVEFAIITSTQTGAWNAGATWVGGTAPGTGDDGIIANTHVVTLPIGGVTTGSCEIQEGGTLAGAGYTLTCDDENGAGLSFDNDGTISGVLDITFTYGALSQVDFVGTAGNPTDIIVNGEGGTVQQTTATTMTTLTVTAGTWDSNDQALTISGVTVIDDILDAGASLIKFGDDLTCDSGTYTYGTSTAQFTSSCIVTDGTNYFYKAILDDNVVITTTSEFTVLYSLEVDGTTAGGFTGGYDIFATNNYNPVKALTLGANADFGNSMVIIRPTTDTIIDGCANFEDLRLQETSNDVTFTVATRGITCANLTLILDATSKTLTFETSTFDLHVTGTTTISIDGPKYAVLNLNGNTIDLDGAISMNAAVTVNAGTSLISMGDNVTITDATFNEGTCNVTFDGVTEQTITWGTNDFCNLTISNTHGSESVIFVNDVDVNGNLTITDGQVDFDTNNPDLDTAWNVTITDGVEITHGTGNWTFSGYTNYTDNSVTTQNIGNITVSGYLYPLSNCSVENVSVTGDLVQTTFWLNVSGDIFNTSTGDITPGTSTVRFINSATLNLSFEHLYNLTLDDDVLLTIINDAYIYVDGILTIDGTTGGGFIGTAIIRLAYQTSVATQILYCGANADFGDTTIFLRLDGTTKMDGCENYGDVYIRRHNTKFVVTLTNRSLTCADFLFESGAGTGLTFETGGYDFQSTGTFTCGLAGATRSYFNSDGNTVELNDVSFISTSVNEFNATGTVSVTGDCDMSGATAIRIENMTFNGTAEQTVTMGTNGFNNLTINNIHASASVIIVNDLDVNGNYSMIDGQIDFDTNDPNIDTAWNVTVTDGVAISPGTGTWTFSVNTNYTDNSATTQDIGDIAVTGWLTFLTNCSVIDVTVTGTMVMSTYYLNTTGNFDVSGGAFTEGTGYLNCIGTAQQTLTLATNELYNLTINNTHATQSVIFAGTQFNVTGTLNFIDGQIDMDTNDPLINTTGNVTISALTTITHGTGTWFFNSSTNLTDSHTVAQNLGDISVAGTLYLLSDVGAENITVNETGTLDASANQILTINGNSTFNITSTITMGSSVWNYNGTTNQTIVCNGHDFYRINVYNTAGLVTFQNDTNISIARWYPGTTIILNDDMTIDRLISVGTAGNRINITSSNLSIIRYVFNPGGNRSFELTDLDSVTFVPPILTPGGGAIGDDPYVEPWPPATVDDGDDDADTGGGGLCSTGVILLGMCIGGGAFALLRDPRKKEE